MLIPDEFASQEGLGDYIDLAFDTTGGGKIIINDSIDGTLLDLDSGIITDDRSKQYKLAFKGDGVLNEDGPKQRILTPTRRRRETNEHDLVF